MLKNFKILIEYGGSAYHGWQRQMNDRSIQQEIENALSTMTAGRVTLIGSGRTDAGVHAYGQGANFLCETDLAPEADRICLKVQFQLKKSRLTGKIVSVIRLGNGSV